MGGFFVPKIHDWEDDYDKHALQQAHYLNS